MSAALTGYWWGVQAMRWPADALHSLATLRLDFNRIGPAGIHALSRAFASGGAAQLQFLYLQASYTNDILSYGSTRARRHPRPCLPALRTTA